MANDKPLILIADDEENMQLLLGEVLKKWGYRVLVAGNGDEALNVCANHRIDLAILDIRMPKKSGLDVLPEIKRLYPGTVVLMLTAFATVQNAVDAMKKGAFDYITKPFKIDELERTIEKALEIRRVTKENSALKQSLHIHHEMEKFVGSGDKIKEVFNRVEKVAPTDYTVLISGESGTGKSLLARIIHETSHRKNGKFVVVNCAAIPESLLESELFGHEKGAFTGAVARRIGKFELAGQGTLFLDEISTMPLAMQAKLLHALQERQFERVGGAETLMLKTRVIAATNRDLNQMVKDGLFREDLFFRLNVVPISLPSLREKKEDIPILVQFFIKKLSNDTGVKYKQITEEALQMLLAYDWPGNVREMENVLKQALVLGDGPDITAEDLPENIRVMSAAAQIRRFSQRNSLDEILTEMERDVILQTLADCGWRRVKAAEKLKISRRSLYNKLEKLGLMDRIPGISHR